MKLNYIKSQYQGVATQSVIGFGCFFCARVGEVLVNHDSAAAGPWNRHHYRIKGNRHYELNNHLGNVLAVVSSSALNDPARYRFGMNGQERETEINANI